MKLVLRRILIVSSIVFLGCSASPPDNWQELPVKELLKCDNKPNCVSSIDTREKFNILPLHFDDASDAAFMRLVKVLEQQERTEVVKELPARIHALRKSALFGFKDDLFFVLDMEKSIIHVRSSARSGYSDFGVNRKQIEIIRKEFEAEASK